MSLGRVGKGSNNCRVPSGVCIYIPGYVYIPFSEIGYVKDMYLTKKVCKTAFTAMFPGYLKWQTCSECLGMPNHKNVPHKKLDSPHLIESALSFYFPSLTSSHSIGCSRKDAPNGTYPNHRQIDVFYR